MGPARTFWDKNVFQKPYPEKIVEKLAFGQKKARLKMMEFAHLL